MVFLQLIDEYTRIVDNSASSLDHIFVKTRFEFSCITPMVLHSRITDHFLVILNMKMNNKTKIRNNNKTPYKYITDFEALKTSLTNVDWDELQSLDVDAATLRFAEIIIHKKPVILCVLK